jgi:Arc/MetJ family transcription regulator
MTSFPIISIIFIRSAAEPIDTLDVVFTLMGTEPATRDRHGGNAGLRGVDYRTNWCCYVRIGIWELLMRSTINLDDELMERAKSLTGTKETAALVRQALETLVRVESGKRLIALGGTMPEAEVARRRRSEVSK